MWPAAVIILAVTGAAVILEQSDAESTPRLWATWLSS